MTHTTSIMLVLAMQAIAPAALPTSVAMLIHPNELFGGWKTEAAVASASFDLELGDSIEAAIVELIPREDGPGDLVVQVQVETSLTIMDDGPHLDLVDWKHHSTDWIDLERIGERRFRMPEIESDAELVSHFPDYTVDELYEAAMSAGGERWATHARAWPHLDDGRVAVGISSVRIRVVTGRPSAPETLFTLHIRIPMGC